MELQKLLKFILTLFSARQYVEYAKSQSWPAHKEYNHEKQSNEFDLGIQSFQRLFFFAGDMEILAYFYGPIGVLLAINLLFFAATARELTCGLWKGEFVKSTTER